MFWNRTTYRYGKEHTYLFLHASTRSPAMIERSLSIRKDFSTPPPLLFRYFYFLFFLTFLKGIPWKRNVFCVAGPSLYRWTVDPGSKWLKLGGFLPVASLKRLKGLDCVSIRICKCSVVKLNHAYILKFWKQLKKCCWFWFVLSLRSIANSCCQITNLWLSFFFLFFFSQAV